MSVTTRVIRAARAPATRNSAASAPSRYGLRTRSPDGRATNVNARAMAAQATHPLTKAAPMELTERYPDAVSFPELAEAAAAHLRAAGNATAAEDLNGML